MRRHHHSRLQAQIFRLAMLLAVLMVALFGLVFSFIAYSTGRQAAMAVLQNKNQAAASLILGYFGPLRYALEYLSGSGTGIDHGTYRSAGTAARLRDLYGAVQSMVPNINFVYSGYRDGSLLINDYEAPPGYNAVERPWYRAAVASAPAISGGIPYQDIKSGEWLVSFSRTLTDRNGETVGVMAIDAGMDSVVTALSVMDEHYPTAYNFVIDRTGLILIHQQEALREQKADPVLSAVALSRDSSGFIEYDFAGERRIAWYTRLETLDWVVVTAVKKSAVFGQVYAITALSLVPVVVITLVAAWVASYLLSKHIIAPLNELLVRVEKTARGLELPAVSSELPGNEIGTIARAIEELTHETLYQKNLELRRKNEMLETLSRTDQLTGIANRRRTAQVLEEEIERSGRYQKSFCVLLFDIDLFKNVNDTYGHDVGDQVLVMVGEAVEAAIRRTDTFGRWGGEEFLIICPEASLATALVVAEKVHAAVKNARFPHGLNITVSMGICEYRQGQSMQELLVAVDYKMYEAKNSGRNRIAY